MISQTENHAYVHVAYFNLIYEFLHHILSFKWIYHRTVTVNLDIDVAFSVLNHYSGRVDVHAMLYLHKVAHRR